MSLSVTLLGQPLAVRPRGEFRFSVTNGQVTVDLEGLNVNGLNVPQEMVNRQVANMKSIAEARVNADVKRALINTGLHVVGVEATEDAAPRSKVQYAPRSPSMASSAAAASMAFLM